MKPSRVSPFTPNVVSWISQQPNTVLLETSLAIRRAKSFVFTDPVEVVSAGRLDQVRPALAKVAEFQRKGLHAAGFVAYEAGYAFEEKFSRVTLDAGLLVWFGIYRQPAVFEHARDRFARTPAWFKKAQQQTPSLRSKSRHTVPTLLNSISFEEYRSAIERIHEHIRAGDTYQVNFTFPQSYRTTDSPDELYCRLRQTQRVPYSAFINAGSDTILSFSPELFFELRGRTLTTKPMKGTIQRGRTLEEDERMAERLRVSEKDRAENLMIVDLLRNDAGKVAKPGSVRVEKFFEVERYETLFQATSTIRATVRNGSSAVDLFPALFPSGSVTGAPKIRTMEIVRELERSARGVYTGCVGYVAPTGDGVFNVGIRTIQFPRGGDTFTLGIGSGITIDSDARSEFEECRTKARFITASPAAFDLFETMYWTRKSRVRNNLLHLRRLRMSALYFGFPYPATAIRRTLAQTVRSLEGGRWKDTSVCVRLRLGPDGSITINADPVKPVTMPLKVALSAQAVDPSDRLLYHKTTARPLYDETLAQAQREGLFDTFFFNTRGELTEGARSNIVLEINGALLTPHWSSGLLRGTFREHLLERNIIREAVLTREDLSRATAIFICNALRGMQQVQLVES